MGAQMAQLPRVTMSKRLGIFSAPVMIVGALILGAMLFGRTVEPGNVGVRIRTFGPNAGVDAQPLQTGWHLMGLGERLVQYPVIQRTYTYTREADERGPENEEVTFSDNTGLPMTADVQIVLQVGANCAPELYTRYRLSFDQLFEGPVRNDVRYGDRRRKRTRQCRADVFRAGARALFSVR